MGGYIGYTKDITSTTEQRVVNTATAGQTVFSLNYSPGYIDVFVNGVKLKPIVDFTATDGGNVVLASPLVLNDEVEIIGHVSSSLYDVYFKAQVDAKIVTYGIAVGSGDAMSVTTTPLISALTDGMEVKVRVPSANTVNNPSITFSNLGVSKTITKLGNQVLVAGDLATNQEITLRFNATSNKLEVVSMIPSPGYKALNGPLYTTNTALTITDFGRVNMFGHATVAGTLTLPNPTLIPPGSLITISNINAANCTIASFTSEAIYARGLSGTSVVLVNGESLTLMNNASTNWLQVSDSKVTPTVNTSVAFRQAVQYGPLTAAGRPDLIPQSQIGNLLAAGVTLKGSTAPFMASMANGFNTDGSQKNINFAFTTDLNSGALTASSTNYIYINSVGTAVVGIVADGFQAGGTIPVTNAVTTTDYLNWLTYVGTGSSATLTPRVCVAEVDTNATAVTAIRVRAYAGSFDSGYTNTLVGVSAAYTQLANLGTTEVTVTEVIQCLTAEVGYSIGDVVNNPMGFTTYPTPPAVQIQKNMIGIRRPSTNAYVAPSVTTGIETVLTAANWKYKLVVKRNF
jgi:hypothetical protein